MRGNLSLRRALPGLWALACLLAALSAAADESPHGYLVRHWGVEEGAPHNTVNGIARTPDGFLWLATDAGLVRFDGVSFRGATSPAFLDAKSSTIRSLIREDADTLLFVNAKSELFRLRGWQVSAYRLAGKPDAGNSMQGLFRERDGIFWISFLNGEVWRCSAGGVERFPAPAKSSSAQLTWATGGHGEIYLSRGAGIERYDGGKLTLLAGTLGRTLAIGTARSGEPWVAEGGQVYRLINDRLAPQGGTGWPPRLNPVLLAEGGDGGLWLGFANYGLVRWTPAGAVVVAELRSRVKSLLEDDQGDMWVATEGNGLNRLRPRRFDLLANPTDTPEEASSVCEDKSGTLWLAGHSSLKVSRGGKLTALSLGLAGPKSPSWVCPDGVGNVWIASGRNVYRATAGGTGAPPARVPVAATSNVRSLYGLPRGGVWLACESGPLIRIRGGVADYFGPGRGYTGTKAEAMTEDSTGRLWVGTGRGELFRLENGRFAAVDVSRFLHGNGIRAIVSDDDGWRWIGTDGEGLLVLHGGAMAVIGRNQGLPDNVISQLLEDDFGFIWFGSRRGMFKVRRQELIECAEGKLTVVAPIVYGIDDGLSDLSAVGGHQPASWKTRVGRLWFTTRAGFLSTQPSGGTVGTSRPKAYLDEAMADGAPMGGAGTAASTTRRFAFRFTSPAYAAPEAVRFRYRLDGFDPDWSEPSSQRLAVYPKLPPGSYRFRVVASDGEGQWSPEPAAVAFTVVPAWWETPAVRVGELLAAAAALAAAVRYGSQRRLKRRLSALEAKERIAAERERIARNLHDGLGAGLTHVGMMAEQLAEDSEGVDEMRQRATRLVDRVQAVARDLDAAVWAVSPRHDRLPALGSYLCEHALEFFRDTAVRCRVEVADDLPDWAISPEARHDLFLAAKEALNNALKHSGARQVTLAMRWTGTLVVIEIADDGHGFDLRTAQASARNGLRNVRERINEAGGRLEVETSRAGTKIKILLPCPSP